ncbi:MAG: Cna B-type domain-containing protein, partial [Clostridiales bacterium]|nr:Cna B-type domain-containing protein [Clostridiales bacterium]
VTETEPSNYKATSTTATGTVDNTTGNVTEADFTNTYTATTSVSGTKTWVDYDNADKTRPGSITVNLLADGTPIDSRTVTADNGWTYEFEKLDVYKKDADGNYVKIVYSITEDAVTRYTSEINGHDITNTYTATTSVSGTKTWVDYENADKTRPESITVNLLSDGTKIASKTVTAGDDWKYEFTDLDVYRKDADGNYVKIVYTVTEDEVENYETVINGYDITNTYTASVSVSGTKTWSDNDNLSGKRPTSITINLLANGEKVDSQVVTADADGNWNYAFTGLDKYDADNKLITYTITEDAVAGYTTTIDGYNVTNTLDAGNLTVTKTVAGSVVDTTKEFSFTVTLSDTTLNGTFGEMTFKDGVATFTLKHGESKTATGIPAGTTYTVTEESYTAD